MLLDTKIGLAIEFVAAAFGNEDNVAAGETKERIRSAIKCDLRPSSIRILGRYGS